MKLHGRLFILALFLLGSVIVADAQITLPNATPKKSDPAPQPRLTAKERREKEKSLRRPPAAGASFYIETVTEPFLQYSILLTDADNRSMPGNFIPSQVEIFQALLTAASEFAATPEASGTKAVPKTTRFVDRHEKAFLIDVEKTEDESRLFITLQSVYGTLTVDAGSVKRGAGAKSTGPEPLFQTIITKVRDAMAGAPPQ
jgi:hypothetical protein